MRHRLWLACAVMLLVSACDQEAADRAKAIKEAEALIAHQLRDPSSAQFRDVRLIGRAVPGAAVCGEVNGRNGYGGYAGFKRFLVNGSLARLEGADLGAYFPDSQPFPEAWTAACGL